MKVINSKLAAIGLAAFVFASCSDSTDTPTSGNGNSVVDATTIGLTEESASSLLSNVVNYKNSTTNARKFFSRAAGDNVTFTTSFKMPVEPATASQIYNNQKNITAGTYYLKGGDKTVEYDFTNKTITGATVYVHGGAKLIYDANTLNNSTIVVEKGGSLIFKGSGEMIKAGNTVYNELGTVKTDGTQDIIIAGDLFSSWRGLTSGKDADGNDVAVKELKSGLGQVDKSNSNEPVQNITIKDGATVSIVGSIRAKVLNIEPGANVYASAHVMNATDINLNGALQVEGFVETADLTVGGYLKAGENTAIKADHALTMKDNSQIDANYVNVTCIAKNSNKKGTEIGQAVLTLEKGCKLNIAKKGVINVDKLVTDNAAEGQITLNEANSVAVVKAEEFHNNGDEYIQAFATPAQNATLLFQFTKSFKGSTELGSAADLDIAASYLDYDKATNGKVVDWKDEAHKRYGYELKVNADEITVAPKLDLFSAEGVKPTSISATSIQSNGGKLYVTYHTQNNGKNYIAGGLEVAHIANGELILDQKVSATDGIDVNHGMIADGRFYVAATTQKEGALLGYVPLKSDGTMDKDQGIKTYPIDKTNSKNGYDANCVVKYDNSFVLATNKGYQVYASDFSTRTPFAGTDVKHLTTDGTYLYSLEAADNNATGTIKKFNSSSLENPETHTTLGNVGVVDGKNTIALDGNNLYVCQGDAGLVRYDAAGNGTKIFAAPTGEKGNIIGRVNGVAVDDNYIYIACGGYGLVVLNKADNKVVAKRRAYRDTSVTTGTGYNSANYVTLQKVGSETYICVAYGKSRVQIFKLTNTKK